VPILAAVALLAVPASVGVDGDPVERIRLVRIETPEVSFRRECLGAVASAATRRAPPRAAARVRARRPGLWGACPGTPADPAPGIDVGGPRPAGS